MPRFPYRRSVESDLEELWAYVRRSAQANRVGNSSLSPDEGALELLDASGNPLAKVGTEGGTTGLLVPSGTGGWRTVQVDAQVRADAAQAAAVADATSKANAAQTAASADATSKANAAQSAAVSSANGYTNTKTAALPGLSSEVAAARGGFANLDARLDDHVSRIGSLEAYDTTISQYATSNIGRLWQDLGALRDWVEQYKSSLPTAPSAPSIRTEQAL